jgi:deoxyribonuclease-4
LTDAEISAFRAAHVESGMNPLVVHDSYSLTSHLLMMLCVPNQSPHLRLNSNVVSNWASLTSSHIRVPTSAVGLTQAWRGLPVPSTRFWQPTWHLSVTILLETTAGQGTTLGRTFGEIATIIHTCRYPQRLAVCLDTCHVLVAGYDFRTPEGCAASVGGIRPDDWPRPPQNHSRQRRPKRCR